MNDMDTTFYSMTEYVLLLLYYLPWHILYTYWYSSGDLLLRTVVKSTVSYLWILSILYHWYRWSVDLWSGPLEERLPYLWLEIIWYSIHGIDTIHLWSDPLEETTISMVNIAWILRNYRFLYDTNTIGLWSDPLGMSTISMVAATWYTWIDAYIYEI
jgi:hypothetical protein